MDFSEKLQNLRKQKGLTQEELAAKLFVSRTAVSKWESGRGYPNIDSLKEISKFFSVSVDELLSSDELITAAQDENRKNISDLLDMLAGCTDIMCVLMIILPLYPEKVSGSFSAVSLFEYAQESFTLACICFALFVLLMVTGTAKLIMNRRHIEKGRNTLTVVSFVLSIVSVLFLTAARLPYAVTVMFLLFIVKGVLVYMVPKK
ncbi:MAG: helix-turn-helix transcriptional regulator [Oscillospiraceae bacterium]|nr:helix-turn-helix transcriptional regulator [Oscillospiraceae bacterium]